VTDADPRPAPAVGDVIEIRIGPIAHGGHWVARTDAGRDSGQDSDQRSGQVVFVRHALEGELVRARVTEDSGRFLRADAIEVLEEAPGRVPAPCPLAHADGCGGCDFQHVDLAVQRASKATVVAEQLRRLAGIEWAVECEAVPGDAAADLGSDLGPGLRWRTRMQYVDLGEGRRGLRKHRSHEVVPVTDCLIAHPEAREVLGSRQARPPGSAGEQAPVVELVETSSGSRRFEVAADGFWQVHPGAPRALVEAVLGQLAPRPGERVLDLYSGVGLFTAFLAGAVGETGTVTAVEGDRRATAYAERNLADLPQTTAVADRVDRWLRHHRAAVDLVVLDPPRSGAKRAVVRAVAELGPRAISYVACDPAALARDTAYLAEAGYRLGDLRCFDLFPMTHHVECVALFVPDGLTGR